MFGRILVPLDGSESAESALNWLNSWNHQSRRTLLHCMPATRDDGRFPSTQEARVYLEGLARKSPSSSDVQVCCGSPVEQILAAADEGVVLLGRRGGVRALGPVAGGVATASPIPVLLVKTPARTPRRRLRRILAPMETGMHREDVLEFLRSVARDLRAEAILLSIRAPREPGAPESSAHSDEQLRCIGEAWKFLKEGIAARSIMTRGRVVDETVSHEQTMDADLVAIPRHDPSWPEIAEQCERPVLLFECTPAPELAAKEILS